MTPPWHHGGMLRRPSLLAVIALSRAWGAGCQGSLTGAKAKEEPKTDCWGRRERDPKDEPLPPSFEPIVLPRPGAKAAPTDEAGLREKREADAADAGWQEKVLLVKELVGSGEDEQALTIVNAALATEPPAPWAARLRELKQEGRHRRV